MSILQPILWLLAFCAVFIVGFFSGSALLMRETTRAGHMRWGGRDFTVRPIVHPVDHDHDFPAGLRSMAAEIERERIRFVKQAFADGAFDGEIAKANHRNKQRSEAYDAE